MKRGHKSGWLYCFKRGDKTVFLNRWDETIKEFTTYNEAGLFANENINLIDIKNGCLN